MQDIQWKWGKQLPSRCAEGVRPVATGPCAPSSCPCNERLCALVTILLWDCAGVAFAARGFPRQGDGIVREDDGSGDAPATSSREGSWWELCSRLRRRHARSSYGRWKGPWRSIYHQTISCKDQDALTLPAAFYSGVCKLNFKDSVFVIFCNTLFVW